ncbi:MAG TPA: MBL fold metallo-hydrolase [Candidatus Phocaeicola gallistercoris]|nr:MBL fold metallo-hydrolase [Candidatus Phocaeicola gallistercoris]
MKLVYLCLTTMMLILAGCGNAARKSGQEQSDAKLLSEQGVQVRQFGAFKVTWIQDVATKQSWEIFPDADKSLIDSLGLQDGIPSSISTYLIEKDSCRILFDTGLGGKNSRLLPLLDSLGLQPDSINYLYLTHLHGDHIGGMMNGDDIVFGHATVFLAKPEYDGWMKMDAEKKAQVVKTMNAYKEQLQFFEFGDTLPGGVITIDAVGHTPGHTAYQLENLLIIGDLIHGAALQMVRPEICPTYDMDKQIAIKSRKRLLKYAEDNDLVMAGMHLPYPGFME